MLKWQDNLQLYLNNNLNVLLCGHGGTGKTSVVKDLFDKNFGDEWLYIAGATCDPFTDLLGIPRPVKDEQTGKEVLEFIKPKKLQLNKVRAIFCDEYNRAPKKVMNALMEIIQFKSLGNESVPNLQMVWCAVNPDDADYNLEEKLDRSQKDRFHIWIDVPYLIDSDYFTSQYGKEMSDGVTEYWSDLSEEIKQQISPRRLQYAIDVWKINGSLREVLPKSANISKLVYNLRYGSLTNQLEKIFDEDDKTIKEKMKDSNLMNAIKNHLGEEKFIKKFTHLLPQEILVEKAPANFEMCSYIKKHSNKFDTSLISTLDGLGCFVQSDFNVAFTTLNKHFPTGNYTSKDRNKIKKVLKFLPVLSKTTIRTADINNLQKLISIMNVYCSSCNYGTVTRDNDQLGFIQKFYEMKTLSETNSLGLDFKSTRGGYSLDYWIDRHVKTEQIKASQATVQGTGTPVSSTTNVAHVGQGILRNGTSVVLNPQTQTWTLNTDV